ncbi:MAG TPA: hypothetical protein VLD63_10720 [Anaerolineales bacterium]|nr:hypothetical protein [Anaerolineales bacterium]
MQGELARKLGLRPGQAVLLIDAPPSADRRLRDAAPAGVRFVRSATAHVDQVFWWPKDLSRLASALARLQKRLQSDGAVWIVMPKKPFAAARGIRFTWEAMQAEGLKGDFVDNKIASFDDQDYATRFVVRKTRRTKPL